MLHFKLNNSKKIRPNQALGENTRILSYRKTGCGIFPTAVSYPFPVKCLIKKLSEVQPTAPLTFAIVSSANTNKVDRRGNILLFYFMFVVLQY